MYLQLVTNNPWVYKALEEHSLASTWHSRLDHLPSLTPGLSHTHKPFPLFGAGLTSAPALCERDNVVTFSCTRDFSVRNKLSSFSKPTFMSMNIHIIPGGCSCQPQILKVHKSNTQKTSGLLWSYMFFFFLTSEPTYFYFSLKAGLVIFMWNKPKQAFPSNTCKEPGLSNSIVTSPLGLNESSLDKLVKKLKTSAKALFNRVLRIVLHRAI